MSSFQQMVVVGLDGGSTLERRRNVLQVGSKSRGFGEPQSPFRAELAE